MIVLSGTIGAGKTSLTKMLAKHLDSQAFYESVDDNPILPLFYQNPKKYGFLLQIYFLNIAKSVLLFPFILKNRFPVRQVWPEEARMQPLYCMD